MLYMRLAWRNLWRHKRRTLIVVLSIGLTLGLMMMYDGLVAGFQDAIYGNAIKVLGGNIQAHAEGFSAEASGNPLLPIEEPQKLILSLENQPGVEMVSPRIVSGGLVTSRASAYGVQIIGIDPAREAAHSLIASNVKDGRYLHAADQDAALIGRGLADALEIGVGDKLSLAGNALHDQTARRTVRVTGIYDLGMPDMEQGAVYLPLAEAQAMLGLDGKVTEIVVQLDKLGGEKQLAGIWQTRFSGPYEWKTWREAYPELESALGTKTKVMDMFGVIMLLVAGIGVFNLLMMAVFERTREIGVLGALGMRPGSISRLFLLEGLFMGLLGVLAGVVFGVGTNLLLGRVGLDYSQFAGGGSFFALLSNRVYPSLGLDKLAQRAITALVITLFSALIPARDAARQEPAKALHFV